MRKTVIAFVCGLIVAGTAWSFQNVVKRSRYTDEVYGYTIDAPRLPGSGANVEGRSVAFSGPSVDGFVSNVNVMVQAIKTTRNDHRALTLEQIKKLGAKLNSDRDLTVSGRDAMMIDFEGKLGSGVRELRFLILSVIDKDRVFLVTCTATPEAFPAALAEFNACIATFRLKDDVLKVSDAGNGRR